MRGWLTGLAALLVLLVLPASATADRVYFGTNSSISYAELDGSGGGNLPTGEATISAPRGVALDPAAGRIYWANGEGTFRISWANLDGSGGGDLPTGKAPVNWPTGVALDKAAGRIYWANYQGPPNERIAYANLDGSGGAVLPTAEEATVGNPQGVAIFGSRIYWSNESGPISFTEFDGSGGGDIDTTGASSGSSEGVAIDPSTMQIYWTRHQIFTPYTANISYASIAEEGGGHDLATGEAPLSFPAGDAIDLDADRIYWANTEAFGAPGSIAYAALDGSGGGSVNLEGATNFGTNYPAILKTPQNLEPPVMRTEDPSMVMSVGAPLVCDGDSWAPDSPEAQLYRAPTTVSYQWLRNGEPVAGAGGQKFKATEAGTYSCRATAGNAAGSTSVPSNTGDLALICPCPGLAGPRAVAARLVRVVGGKARLAVRCPHSSSCAGSAALFAAHRYGRGARRYGRNKLRRYSLSRRFRIAPGKKKVVKLPLLDSAASLLREAANHRMKASVAGANLLSRRVVLKEVTHRERRSHR
jgi:hypothetical protein